MFPFALYCNGELTRNINSGVWLSGSVQSYAWSCRRGARISLTGFCLAQRKCEAKKLPDLYALKFKLEASNG
jgi:hypothetical protein